jgi:hypothetical protein
MTRRFRGAAFNSDAEISARGVNARSDRQRTVPTPPRDDAGPTPSSTVAGAAVAEFLNKPRLLGSICDQFDVAAVEHVQRRVRQQPAHDLGVRQRDDRIIGAGED